MKYYLYVKTGPGTFSLVEREFTSHEQALDFLFENREMYGITGQSKSDPEFVNSKLYKIYNENEIRAEAEKEERRRQLKEKVKGKAKEAGKALADVTVGMAKETGMTKEQMEQKMKRLQLESARLQNEAQRVSISQQKRGFGFDPYGGRRPPEQERRAFGYQQPRDRPEYQEPYTQEPHPEERREPPRREPQPKRESFLDRFGRGGPVMIGREHMGRGGIRFEQPEQKKLSFREPERKSLNIRTEPHFYRPHIVGEKESKKRKRK